MVIERSRNSKVGTCSATYAPQSTCPVSCPLRGEGCYGETGRVGIYGSVMTKTNRTRRYSASRLAQIEAREIRALSGRRPLRVHVLGDCRDRVAAMAIGRAMVAHTAKHGEPAWTYTHSWPVIPARAWAGADVLASCDDPSEVPRAQRKGYATALLVEMFHVAQRHMVGKVDLLPCPAQTRGIQCVNCGLCMKTTYLRDKALTIGFEAH